MNVMQAASEFCEALVQHRIRYQMDVIRDDAILISVAVPGERWEIEFINDGAVELERFVTQGVEECTNPLAMLRARYQ